jgi:hypothetical protein
VKKISDRLILGAVSGVIANIPKLLIGKGGIKLKISEIDGPEMAAGIFIPPHKLALTSGKVVGHLADMVIAGILGTVTVYTLTITGKDKYALKGVLAGQVMWQGLYGLLTSFGASQVKAYSPKTVLNEALSHAVFGLTAAVVAANLGDEKLFTGQIPFIAGTQTPVNQSETNDLSNMQARRQFMMRTKVDDSESALQTPQKNL